MQTDGRAVELMTWSSLRGSDTILRQAVRCQWALRRHVTRAGTRALTTGTTSDAALRPFGPFHPDARNCRQQETRQYNIVSGAASVPQTALRVLPVCPPVHLFVWPAFVNKRQSIEKTKIQRWTFNFPGVSIFINQQR